MTHKCTLTLLATSAIAAEHLLVKFGADAQHAVLAGAADLPIGTVPDTPSAGDECAVNLLGATNETIEMVASAAIDAGALVCVTTGGKVKTLPTANGTYYVVGQTVSAAAANNDLVEVVSCVPYKIVIS